MWVCEWSEPEPDSGWVKTGPLRPDSPEVTENGARCSHGGVKRVGKELDHVPVGAENGDSKSGSVAINMLPRVHEMERDPLLKGRTVPEWGKDGRIPRTHRGVMSQTDSGWRGFKERKG